MAAFTTATILAQSLLERKGKKLPPGLSGQEYFAELEKLEVQFLREVQADVLEYAARMLGDFERWRVTIKEDLERQARELRANERKNQT